MIFKSMRPFSFDRVVIYSLNLFLFFLTVTSTAQKEIEITSFYAKVYVAPSRNANFIGLTQKGERYPILGIRDSWYNIRFKNANGWVEGKLVRVIDPYAVAVQETTGTRDEDTARNDTSNAPVVTAESTVTSPEAIESTMISDSGAPRAISSSRQPEIRASSQAASRSSSSSSGRQASTSRSRRRHEPERKSSPPKKDTRLRSWFTQQKLPELPPTIIPEEDQIASLRYFQVRFPARVLEYLSPEAPILGMAKKGSLLPLVAEGDSWCRVVFADTIGWVERKHGKVIDPDDSVSIDYVKLGLIIGIIILLLIIIIILLSARQGRKSGGIDRGTNVKKNVLVIAKTAKVVQYTLTNGTTTLERCFTEVGFKITHAKDSAAIKGYLQNNIPDIIMVDYKFDTSIISSVERICAPMGIGATTLFIAYNVPDPAIMHPSKVLPKMAFLGITFSDRDVFKLVTPMLHNTAKGTIQKSVQSSALEGSIGEGNLLEVLQFIEIGSKTGCLLIELNKPFAIICFKNGRIVFAATAEKITGRDAIFKVLDLKEGKFRFVLDKKPKEANVNLSTLEILMEWAKAVDEARRH